jgi:hypothetical protein
MCGFSRMLPRGGVFRVLPGGARELFPGWLLLRGWWLAKTARMKRIVSFLGPMLIERGEELVPLDVLARRADCLGPTFI